jgi:hypothetical protein
MEDNMEKLEKEVMVLPELPKMEFVFDNNKIVPAKIDSEMINFKEAEEQVKEIEKLKEVIFNDVDDIKKYRLEVATKKANAQKFKEDLMNYLNRETKDVNKKLIDIVNRLEDVRAYLHQKEKELDTAKAEKIESIKKLVFEDRKDYLVYLVDNPRWKNKTFSESKIEGEVQQQYDELIKKEEFIKLELEKANADLEFVITFEETKHLIKEDYYIISNKITEKRNDRKATEENLRRKAEEQAKIEAEEKIRKEQAEQIKLEEKENAVTEKSEDVSINVSKKDTYISIKVSGLSKEATNDLLEVIKKHDLKYTKEMK